MRYPTHTEEAHAGPSVQSLDVQGLLSCCHTESQLRDGALPQENEFTEAVLGGLLADELEAEMKARIPTSDRSVPQRLGQYWYYWHRGVGQQYKVHARSVSC